MKVILQRIWKEPAVCIGLLASLILLLLEFLGDDKFTADSIIAICAPLVSALGIRQTVTPALEPPATTGTETPSEPAAPPKPDPIAQVGDAEVGDAPVVPDPAPESASGPAPGEIVSE